jgi:hypothetical protein
MQLNEVHRAESFLRKLIVAQPVKFAPFVTPKALLLCTQKPNSGHCPEQDESDPNPNTLFL